ncbi:hypothetical protein GCM10017673_40920 [Streptosporangium violaceochromogenes]|nr:hypothetical protein GCM10017673_40920 [Streptosporangium violaceochromogenes]
MRRSIARALAVPLAFAGVIATVPIASAETSAAGPDGGSHARGGRTVELWAGPVNMRSGPTTWDAVVGKVDRGTYWASCRRTGQTINFGKYRSTNWSYIHNHGTGGYVANVCIKGPDPVPGLDTCPNATN